MCINNAGLAHNAPILTGETHYWRDMLEVKSLDIYNTVIYIHYYHYRLMC